jgi:hypothetical protein
LGLDLIPDGPIDNPGVIAPLGLALVLNLTDIERIARIV